MGKQKNINGWGRMYKAMVKELSKQLGIANGKDPTEIKLRNLKR